MSGQGVDGMQTGAGDVRADWDHSTHDAFYDYYARESGSIEARRRFERMRDAIMRFVQRPAGRPLEVADVGCGAGTQSIVWAEAGEMVHAVDVNERLIELGRSRAEAAGLTIDFRLGSATDLPWANESMDVCIAPELIEHVADWEGCIREFVRVLRPGGILLMTTTNRLCPIQEEFNLPLYSWYPSALKRRYERLSTTTRPELANYARYPAVNWFTFYGLRRYLAARGFRSVDRFGMMDVTGKSAAAKAVVSAIRSLPPLRFLGQMATPGTRILAIKSGPAAGEARAGQQ